MKKNIVFIHPSGVRGLLVLLLLMIAISCKRKDPEPSLPPETQEGKNTFGCMLNGRVWIATPQEGRLYIDIDSDGMYLYATLRDDSKKIFEKISILGTLNGVGTYEIITANSQARIAFDNLEENYTLDSLSPNTKSSGTLNIIRFDLQKRIVSGTFNFNLEKAGVGKVEAKDGCFDLKF